MKTLWNVLIAVLFIILVFLLGRPQYILSRKMASNHAVYSNMHTLRAAAEKYAAYNEGVFPVSAEELKQYLSLLGEEILNPFTNENIQFPIIKISPEGDTIIQQGDVKIVTYQFRDQHKEQGEDSKNSRLRGRPGGLSYGYYIPPGDSLARAYGIVGFDEDGMPIADPNPAGGVIVRVLINLE